MRKVLSLLIIPVLLVGCAKVKEAEVPQEQEGLHEVVFHAGWDPETRTVLQEDGNVWWEPEDEISLFTGPGTEGGYRLSATIGEPSPVADFVGEIGDGMLFSAVYPYDDYDSFDGTDFVVFFNDQVAREGSFAKRAFKSIAQSSDDHLFFKNLCGGIKFSVANEGISRIILEADTSTPFSGWLKFRINENGEPEYTGEKNAHSEYCIYAPDFGSFETNKPYYIVLPATSMPNGLKIIYYKEDDVAEWSSEWSCPTPVEIHRSAFKRLDAVDGDLTFHLIKHKKAAVLYSFLPDDIGKEKITDIEFHVNDATVTGNQLSASVPVYYDVDGTVVNIYTSADLFDISEVTTRMFWRYFALKTLDLSKTIVPNCGSFFRMFGECVSLESIVFGDWDTHKVGSMEFMFQGCETLKSLDLSFMDTRNLENMNRMFDNCHSLSSLNLGSFNTSKVTKMGGVFCNCGALSSLDLQSFDTRQVIDMSGMFGSCTILQNLDLSHFDTGNVRTMCGMFAGCENLKQLDLSSFDTSNVEDFSSMFAEFRGLDCLDLSNFTTTNALDMSWMFGNSTNIKELDISSFSSESLESAEYMFGGCAKLQKLNLGALDLSKSNSHNIAPNLMIVSKAGAIRCIPETRAILEQSLDDSLAGKIEWMSLSDDISTYEYLRNPNLYYSSDFSKHETVRKLYSATKGKGIDIVLMGDVYSDRMIASGLYDADMELAADAIFAKEPMASFKDYFNVYIVYLVSENEVIGESTALNSVASGVGFLEGYASAEILPYYRTLATGNGDITTSEHIVIVNDTDHVSGYTNMESNWASYGPPDPNRGDYGYGFASVVVGRGDHNFSKEFQITVAHEFGHSFAKLADEYFREGTSPEGPEYVSIISELNGIGWYKNVDLTSDPETIKWSRFLNDERYAEDGVGVFEGGYLYSQGVWRPSENSIMRYGSEFNAPSRAAIYYRIHKLAYGDDWQFDYEDFVQWDTKNIGLEKRALPSNTKAHHPHFRQKPFVQIQKEITKDGLNKLTVIMN